MSKPAVSREKLVSNSCPPLSRRAGSSLPCLPTFVGIGSMRCGSTWLYEVLRSHPDVRLSDAKELDFAIQSAV